MRYVWQLRVIVHDENKDTGTGLGGVTQASIPTCSHKTQTHLRRYRAHSNGILETLVANNISIAIG